jgi:hypothetical protein
MDNLLLKKEAKRIYKEIIKFNETNKSLDKIFNELLDKKYKQYNMKILMYLTNILAENNYVIENTDPLKIIRK